jgi:hypothetical protein
MLLGSTLHETIFMPRFSSTRTKKAPMTKSHFSFTHVAITFVIIFLSAYSVAGQQIGYVMDIQGSWFLNNAQQLRTGSPLPVGGRITTNSPDDRNFYIVVADRNGNVIGKRHCRNSGECNEPLLLPQEKSASVTQTFLSLVVRLFAPTPQKYTPLISKGEELQEAVVKLTSSGIDLKDVFRDREAGDYFLQFKMLGRKRPLQPVAFKWDPENSELLRVRGLKPGLFSVSIVTKEERGFGETSADAWILVTNAAQYPRASASFAEAVELTKSWDNQVKPDIVRGFLRASLDAINRQLQKRRRT